MHDISGHCMFVQLKELKRLMAAQRPSVAEPEPEPAQRIAFRGGLAALLRRVRIAPAMAEGAEGGR